MYIHQIEARDLPDLWFLAVHDILDNGKRFVIDRGSYAGQTRLEYDYFMGHVKHPGTQPLIPDIPPACGIPNPVEHDYIYGGSGYDRAYIEYLMSARKEPGESYTYGERLTKVPLTGDKLAWWEAGNAEIVDKREVDGSAVFEENGQLYLNQIEWIINIRPVCDPSTPAFRMTPCIFLYISGPGTCGMDFQPTWQPFKI
jgi:thymidylate synthase